ncbi:MAG: DUF4249 domain-containing protein [Bacteroidales bacterium]|nr:DUF4249 domain-containing protein [Bacteroidales bacterium]
MSIHQIKRISWWVLAVCMSCACVEDVDLEKEREQKIVVNCVLTSDTVQALSLTYSNPLNQFYYNEVEDAIATLWLNGDKVGQFEKTSFSKWQIKHQAQPGGSYQLNVEVPGWKEIEATTIMPDYVTVLKSEGDDTPTIRNFMQLYASAPYWMFALQQAQDTIMLWPKVLPGDKLQISIGTNHPYRDGFNATEEMMFVNGITRQHIAYLRIGTPENPDEEIPFMLEASLDFALVFVRSVSAEYDMYLKSSVQKMLVYHVFDDPTQWFDENEIYTNISNGLGIFAAYNEYIIQCHRDLDRLEYP